MKVYIDDKEIFEITPTDLDLFSDEIVTCDVQADIERRLQWVISHKCEQLYKRFKEEWTTKLASEGVTSVPLAKDAFVALVKASPNYKNRSTRDAEELVVKNK